MINSTLTLTLAGALRITQAFTPLLIVSKGSVVNIGSIVGYFRQPYIGMRFQINPPPVYLNGTDRFRCL